MGRMKDIDPSHSLERFVLCSAFPGTKNLERVPATPVHGIYELKHAVAGLEAWWL